MPAPEELDRAVRDVEDRVQFRRRVRDRALWQSCVLAWCEVLGWPPEAAEAAIGLDRAHAAHLGRVAISFESEMRRKKKAASVLARVADQTKKVAAQFDDGLRADPLEYSNANDEALSKMEPRDYILIALSITAAGFVAYRLTRRPKLPVEPPPPSAKPLPNRWVLVLIINAGRQGVIDALRTGGVAALEGDQLYQATQALWLGGESEFRGSSLQDWFSGARAVSEPSEYDVYLVRVELSANDPGLHRNANQMDRLDAFRRVQAMGLRATVSRRLPSEAYGTTDVYSR